MDAEFKGCNEERSSAIGSGLLIPLLKPSNPSDIVMSKEAPQGITQRNEIIPESPNHPGVTGHGPTSGASSHTQNRKRFPNILEMIAKINKGNNWDYQTIWDDPNENVSDMDLEKLYIEFINWKIFEKRFDWTIQMSIFEVQKEKTLIAFRLDKLKIIKVINFRETKEYSFEENDKYPIEFLKFIGEGQKIIMVNRAFIHVWEIEKNLFYNFDILDKCEELQLDMDRIHANKANGFIVSSISSQYYMHFTISDMIFLIEIQSNEIDVKYEKLSSTIIFFSLKDGFIFSIINPERNKFIIEVRDALTLALKDKFNIATGNYSYFSTPILSSTKKVTNVKFYVLEECILKTLEISLKLNEIDKGDSVNKIISPKCINTNFSDSKKIHRVWHASDDKIIINYKFKTSGVKAEGSSLHGEFTKNLTLIQQFTTPLQEIIVSNSSLFAYSNKTLSILSKDSNKFNGNLSFSSEIQSVCIIEDFIFVKTVEGTSCWEMLNMPNGVLNKTLNANDFARFSYLSHSVRKKLITILYYARDADSLQFYLENIKEFNKNDGIESLSISEAIDRKATECLDILLNYYSNKINEGDEIDDLIKDIQSNFAKILTCCSKNLIPLLNSLLKSRKEVGKLNTDRIPILQFYECKTDRLNDIIFNSKESEIDEYDIKNTVIMLPEICGSNYSIEITKALMECNKSIFTSDLIKYYINSKWADLWFIILCQTLVNWTNCLLVMYVIMIDPNSLYARIAMLLINIIRAGCEILQVANLGIRKYMGIQETKILWNLSVIISLGFIFTNSIILVGIYMAVQIVSLRYDFKVNCIEIAILSFPSIIFIGLFAIPDNYVYCFFIFISYEIGLYLKSIMSHGEDIVERSYVKIIALLVFLGYSCDNIYIALLLSCVCVIERIYDMYMLSEYYRTPSIIMNFTEICSLSLIWSSYIKKSTVYAEFSLVLILIAHAYLWHIKILRSETILSSRKYSVFYSIYLLIAYLESQNNLFLISFLALSGFEWIYLKLYSIANLNNDVAKLLLNWNSLDICRIVITFFWIVSSFFSFKISARLNWFLVLFTFIRGLTGFRAFSWTRFYVRLILSSVMDITSFLLIFVYIAVCFGVLNFITGKVEGNLFEVLWIIPYDTAFSNFDHDTDLGLGYISFLLASLLIIVVMLNLLISVLSTSYQQCQIRSSELDHMEMIETIFEAEILKIWNKDKNTEAFLAICDFTHGDKEENIVSGKLQDIYKIIKKLRKKTNEYDQGLPEIKKDLREILELLRKKSKQ